jgi:hypothetical protein
MLTLISMSKIAEWSTHEPPIPLAFATIPNILHLKYLIHTVRLPVLHWLELATLGIMLMNIWDPPLPSV